MHAHHPINYKPFNQYKYIRSRKEDLWVLDLGVRSNFSHLLLSPITCVLLACLSARLQWELRFKYELHWGGCRPLFTLCYQIYQWWGEKKPTLTLAKLADQLVPLSAVVCFLPESTTSDSLESISQQNRKCRNWHGIQEKLGIYLYPSLGPEGERWKAYSRCWYGELIEWKDQEDNEIEKLRAVLKP